MKTALIYLHVVGRSDSTAPPPGHYTPWSRRFADSYAVWGDLLVPRDLVVVNCGGPPTPESWQIFPEALHLSYVGGGWDIGAHQFALRSLNQMDVKYDFAICMATPTYFWRSGFLSRMLEAREKFGDGLYGPTASYENVPHIRTCCWACDPATFAKYPHTIDDREKTFMAESGAWSINYWYRDQGLSRVMVAVDGFYEQDDWRKPDNIFRRGDQSNCLIRDRHTDIWDGASAEERTISSNLADGKN